MGKGSQMEIIRDITKEISELERRGDRSINLSCFSQPTSRVGPASLVAVKNPDNSALTLQALPTFSAPASPKTPMRDGCTHMTG